MLNLGKIIPLLLVAVFLAGATETPADSDMNLYEWIAVADEVVVGRVLAQEGKHVLVRAENPLKGSIPAGSDLLVAQREANRKRTSSQRALRLKHGLRYMLLLNYSGQSGKKADALPVYSLARGVAGAREMPREGEPAMIEAVETFIRIQEMNSDSAQWRSFAELVGDGSNHLVTITALQMFLKYRRGTGACC